MNPLHFSFSVSTDWWSPGHKVSPMKLCDPSPSSDRRPFAVWLNDEMETFRNPVNHFLSANNRLSDYLCLASPIKQVVTLAGTVRQINHVIVLR
jgi:hypothetical protein